MFTAHLSCSGYGHAGHAALIIGPQPMRSRGAVASTSGSRTRSGCHEAAALGRAGRS
ncbi:hypothetical protein PJI17_20515 [Mycobacterium kansasii]